MLIKINLLSIAVTCVQNIPATVITNYGMVHRKHDGNSVCQLVLFIIIAPLTVNIFDYLLAFNR